MKAISKNVNGIKINAEIFESIFDLTKTNKTRPIREDWKKQELERSIERDPDWYGAPSLKQAYENLIYGWDCEIKPSEFFDVEGKKNKARKIFFENSVEGFIPNIPNYLLGLPNTMIDCKRTIKIVKNKILNIVFDSGAHCGISTKEIEKSGKRLVELIVGLENIGYRCNVYVMNTAVVDDRQSDSCLLRIKSDKQGFNIKKMLYPLISASYFRCCWFDWQDRCPTTKFDYGRGQPLGVSSKKLIISKALEEELGNNYKIVDHDMIKNIKPGEEIDFFKKLFGISKNGV